MALPMHLLSAARTHQSRERGGGRAGARKKHLRGKRREMNRLRESKEAFCIFIAFDAGNCSLRCLCVCEVAERELHEDGWNFFFLFVPNLLWNQIYVLSPNLLNLNKTKPITLLKI